MIARGIERRRIFHSDRDREAFVDRLEALVLETGAGLYAWALMPNHAHALLRTGDLPLSRLVQRWLGPYATTFNLIHDRAGHLFQNRFKSTLVEEDAYLLALVRYIHLNPVRSTLAVTIDDLDHYAWTGHAALLGNAVHHSQDTAFVLAQFGRSVGRARRAYRNFVRDGMLGDVEDLEGGGLRRSASGWEFVPRPTSGRERWAFDERILGGGEFVEGVLRQFEEQIPSSVSKSGPDKLEELCARVGLLMNLTLPEICGASLRPCVLEARAVVSHIAVRHYGFSMTATAEFLGISRQSVWRSLDRAKGSCGRRGCSLAEFLPD